MALLPVAEALSRILEGVRPVPAEPVCLRDAAQRILAEPVIATLTQPPFRSSAMDGYAVRAADVAVLPARLKVMGESAAGRGWHRTIGAGECVRIFTGAPLPEGADAVVIQENTRPEDGHVMVTEGIPDRAHVRAMGSDFKVGERLLEHGQRLDARAITLAAAAGHGTLTVRRKPVVAILATGDELVPPGTPPALDQIVASNSYGLAAMVEAWGGEARLLGIARDTRADLEAKIAAAAGADILLTSGGASEGDHDLVGPALRARGMTPGFWKIAMRPGKPLLFGRLGETRVLGLPGNPVSSLICGRVFVVPLLNALLGLPAETQKAGRARLSVPLEANGPRAHYMRATTSESEDGMPTVAPVFTQDSALLSPIVRANCLIVRATGAPAAKAGDAVDVLRLDF